MKLLIKVGWVYPEHGKVSRQWPLQAEDLCLLGFEPDLNWSMGVKNLGGEHSDVKDSWEQAGMHNGCIKASGIPACVGHIEPFEGGVHGRQVLEA